MTTTENRERLARYVHRRRVELGLSVNQAAQIAGVSKGTWQGLEKARRETGEHKYAGIERALKWKPGSILAVLKEGGVPQPVNGGAPEPERPRPGDIDAAIAAIEQVEGAPEWWKAVIRQQLEGLKRERERRVG